MNEQQEITRKNEEDSLIAEPTVLTVTCRRCLEEIDFSINHNKFSQKSYPIRLSNRHGSPEHELTILVNEKLEVQSFEINEMKEFQNDGNSIQDKATHEVLTGIGLSDEEIDLYFKCTGKGPIS